MLFQQKLLRRTNCSYRTNGMIRWTPWNSFRQPQTLMYWVAPRISQGVLPTHLPDLFGQPISRHPNLSAGILSRGEAQSLRKRRLHSGFTTHLTYLFQTVFFPGTVLALYRPPLIFQGFLRRHILPFVLMRNFLLEIRTLHPLFYRGTFPMATGRCLFRIYRFQCKD